MGLEKLLTKEIEKTRVSITRNKEKTLDYLMRHELSPYFSGDDRERNKDILRERLEESFAKYQTELGGFARKATSKSSMWLDVANQIYGYVSKVPVSYVGGLSTSLFLTKTLAEIPALNRYRAKSKDFYGIGRYLAMKSLRWLIPVIGPALESGAFERMIMRRVMTETKNNFLKEIGRYQDSKEYIHQKMKAPIQDLMIPFEKAA